MAFSYLPAALLVIPSIKAVDHTYMAEPLIWTAGAYFVIGLILIIAAFRLWAMHPLQRAPRMLVHLTPEGSKMVLKRWPLVYLFGAFILSCAFEHAAHWAYPHGLATKEMVFGLAVAEAIISVVTAVYVLWLSTIWGVRQWRNR